MSSPRQPEVLILRKCALAVSSMVLVGSVASAQGYRVELSGAVGYTFGDGVTFPGTLFDSVGAENAFSYNFTLGVLLSERFEVEFLWARQPTALLLSGPGQRVAVDGLDIDNFHAFFSYNWGDDEDPVRPYLGGGGGATSYRSLTVQGVAVPGRTRFSTTWGAGVKVYPRGNSFGLKLGIRWTPTYIQSEPGGVWCDPYWGCFTTGNAQYSNQFEFLGGVMFRF
jgi:hypothetical protein